jgi:hypothetical protein
MLRFIENLVLETPYLFLKKIPYAWVAAVALWAWPPVAAGAFLAIILFGLLMMVLQGIFWERKITREHQKSGQPFRDRPRASPGFQLRNLALVLAGSALLGLLLEGRLGLQGWQWFLLSAGLMVLYKDTLVFGAAAVYLVTEDGIGARYVPAHVDYRLFFKYREIKQVKRVKEGDKIPGDTFVLSPTRKPGDGVLLIPNRSTGFSPRIGHVLLTPTDVETFLAKLPAYLAADFPPQRQ